MINKKNSLQAETKKQSNENKETVNNLLNLIGSMVKLDPNKAAKAANESAAAAAERETEESLCVARELAETLKRGVNHGLKLDYAPPVKAWFDALKEPDLEGFVNVLDKSREACHWVLTELSSEEIECASIMLDVILKNKQEKFIPVGKADFSDPTFVLLEDCDVKRVNKSSNNKSEQGKRNTTLFLEGYGDGVQKGYGKLSETTHSLVTHVCSPKCVGLEHFDRVDEFNRQAREAYLLSMGRCLKEESPSVIFFDNKQSA